MKFLEYHLRITKIITIKVFNARIIKIIKKHRIACESQPNHQNQIIPFENHYNHEFIRISYANHATHEILIVTQQITQVMEFLEFSLKNHANYENQIIRRYNHENS